MMRSKETQVNRNMLNVLITRARDVAPRGYFLHREGGPVRVARRPVYTPVPAVAAALAARMVRP